MKQRLPNPRQTRSMVAPLSFLTVLAAALLLAVPALAAVPQTIVIDGVNDFDPSNLMEDDGGDTETKNWCTADPEDDSPMDIGEVYLTNDTNNLYIGFQYDRDCFASPQVNLGIAFSYGPEADGGNTDPFDRKIAWNTITRKPDNVFYVVLDGFNYEVLYGWNGLDWDNISTLVNPGWGSGSNGLGMANDSGFEELSLPLSVLGSVIPGQIMHVEIWMTQDGTTKPPLDAVGSDDVQTSTPAGTVFDLLPADPPIEMSAYLQYTIQADVDTDPPEVTSGSYSSTTGLFDITFNEPVDQTTAETAGNYSLAGGTSPATVVSAARDAAAHNVVHLTLSNNLVASADAYEVTVTNVQDEAGNPIINDGMSNVACIGLKGVTFQGLFGPYLAGNSSPPDGFTVEGGTPPLTWAVCDGGDMVDTGIDDTWEYTALFSFPVDCGDDSGSLTVEWKFNHNCVNWESVGNRSTTLDIASPSIQTVSAWWNDQDPDAFTDKDIDVIFTVDMFRETPTPSDLITMGGNVLPLDFNVPTWPLVDDGTGEDETAHDWIFTTVVRFPAGSLKNVEFKYLLNGTFECETTGNRGVFLNDEVFDIIGGTNGPITMPLAYYDRCYTLGRDVEVVFTVDLRDSAIFPPSKAQVADVGLTGSVLPLTWDIETAYRLADDGLGHDAVAGDNIYSGSITFPDDASVLLEYKFTVNGLYEGLGLPNRFVWISDQFDALGNPQVLPLADIHITYPVGREDQPVPRMAALRMAKPNPFNPSTTIVFEVADRSRTRIEVFDVRGRLVTTLADRVYEPGIHEVRWDGRSASGQLVSSGVYYGLLSNAGQEDSMKLVLLK